MGLFLKVRGSRQSKKKKKSSYGQQIRLGHQDPECTTSHNEAYQHVMWFSVVNVREHLENCERKTRILTILPLSLNSIFSAQQAIVSH